MKTDLRVFIDSDIVISSLISPTGAAYILVNQTKVKKFVSNISVKELKLVVTKLKLKPEQLTRSIKNNLTMIKLRLGLSLIKIKYGKYVTDINDSHVVAGAKEAKTNFIVTYNIKHFQKDLIKKDLRIIIMRPGEFLQFHRNN